MALHRRILTPTPIDGPDSSSPLPSSLAATASPRDRHLSNLFIAAGCLGAAAFFLALTYYAVFNRRWRRRRRPIAAPHSVSDPDDFIDTDGEHDHHLWHIRTVGLDEAAISSIAVYEYTTKGNLISSTDCSVCLAEFADGELVRLLPKCAHAFHVGCIDTWLRAHVSCPLCRDPVVATTEGETIFHSAEEDFGTVGVRENSILGVPGEEAIDLSSASSEPVRRSVSLPVVEMEGSFREEEKEPVGEESSRGKQENTSKETEKSMSSSGRSFFFSKNGRSRSLVLPL